MTCPSDVPEGEELERRFPALNWREPIGVVIQGQGPGWSCRICIAQSGYKARDPKPFFDTEAQAQEHVNGHFG